MSAQGIGLLSGGLVVLSIIPYAFRVYQKKIHPVPTSWTLWSLIGLALLLTYRSSGAGANVWPAVFGFTNPVLITILAIRQKERWKKLESYEWACLIFGLASLTAWVFVQNSKELSQYVLYLAIIADLCAAIPTFIFFKREPMKDRPFAWICFAIGYFLAIFAITDRTFANYALPIYMSVGSSAASLLLIFPRLKNKTPLREWV